MVSLYFAPFSFLSTSPPVSVAEKNTSQHDAATTIIHHWDGVGQVMSGYLQTWWSEWKDSLLLVSSDQIILFLTIGEPFCKLQVCFYVLFTKDRLPSDHFVIKPRLVECYRGCSSGSYSEVHTGSLNSATVTTRFLVMSLTNICLPQLLSSEGSVGRVLLFQSFSILELCMLWCFGELAYTRFFPPDLFLDTALSCIVSAVTPYIDWCVPFQTMPN